MKPNRNSIIYAAVFTFVVCIVFVVILAIANQVTISRVNANKKLESHLFEDLLDWHAGPGSFFGSAVVQGLFRPSLSPAVGPGPVASLAGFRRGPVLQLPFPITRAMRRSGAADAKPGKFKGKHLSPVHLKTRSIISVGSIRSCGFLPCQGDQFSVPGK